VTLPDDLSPAPELLLLQPTALPFDLTWADLREALPGGTVGGRAVVSHSKRGQHQGGHPSVIMTLSYDAPSGQPCQTTLFFKLNPHDCREAQRYRFLTDREIPVPHLAVCVERDNEEVLGLQFLPSIGVGPTDVDDVLRLVAALNSLSDVPDAIGNTPPGLPQAQFENLLTRALGEMRGADPHHVTATWLNTYRRAVVLYENLPTALTHGELAAQQLGRTEDGILVMLDLATVGRRPRFADIANLLATLAHLAGEDERSLFGDYLGYLTAGTGPTLDDRSWSELQLTRFVQAVEALPWHVSLQQPSELHQHLETIAADHGATLAQLGP
jgi:hypothetical protein